jgi:hypothetical protein
MSTKHASTRLAALHSDNMRFLKHRAMMQRCPDRKERLLHLEVAEKHAGGLLPPYVCAVEWEAPGHYRGDLVFCDAAFGTAAVVEVKHISSTASPETQQRRIEKLRYQAMVYKDRWEIMHPWMMVYACTYTNRDGLVFVSGSEQYII